MTLPIKKRKVSCRLAHPIQIHESSLCSSFLFGKEAGNLSTHIFVLIVYAYKPQMAGRRISLRVHRVSCVGERYTFIPVVNVTTRLSRSAVAYSRLGLPTRSIPPRVL